jgi:uncharacterized membrane protein
MEGRTAAPSISPTGSYALMTPLIGLALLAVGIIFLWQGPDRYSAIKGVHVAFAVLWVGGGATLTILGIAAEARNDQGQLATIGALAAWIGERIFTPSALIVLGFGIWLVEEGSLGWGHFWIDFALVIWAVSAATGIFVLNPLTKKLTAAAEREGFGSPTVQRYLRMVLVVARIDIALLVLVVIDMTAKPFA